MSKHTEEILERIAGEDLRKKVIILNKKEIIKWRFYKEDKIWQK